MKVINISTNENVTHIRCIGGICLVNESWAKSKENVASVSKKQEKKQEARDGGFDKGYNNK